MLLHYDRIQRRILLSLTLLFCVGYNQALFAQSNNTIVQLENWQYRIGESPENENGLPTWLTDEETSENWQSFQGAGSIEKPKDRSAVWIRAKVPAGDLTERYMLNYNLIPDFEIYFGQTRIQKIGNFVPQLMAGKDFTDYMPRPFVRLPTSDDAEWIVIKFNQIDYFTARPIYIGNHADLYMKLIEGDLIRIAIGIFAILIGLFLLVLMRGISNKNAIISFIIFAISAGTYLLIDNFAVMIFSKFSKPLYIAQGIALSLVPIGGARFIENIFGAGYKSIIRRIWQTHLIFTLVFIVLLLFTGFNFNLWTTYISPVFFIMLITGFIIQFVFVTHRSTKGDTDAKIYVYGIIIFILAGIHDAFIGLGYLTYFVLMLHWGVFIFILSLGWILKRQFIESKNKLEDYSQNLEKKVKDRTKQLDSKNRKLADTLRQVKTMQKQIITQEKLASLGTLTAGVAHEIKNPLNFINNFAQLSADMVRDLKIDIESQKNNIDVNARKEILETLKNLEQFSKKTNEHGQRANNIVNNMLQHSRSKTVEFQSIDINKLLEEYLQLSYHGMRAADSTFMVTIHKDSGKLKKVKIDPQNMSRVFINLFNNAFYAVQSKQKENLSNYIPEVHISTKELQKTIEIRVKDNGNGIPKSILDKIFTPFFTTKPAGVGTGLGLSITHEIIVQEHKGEISVKSKEGEYAEFVIRLPK
ncbi:MAG: ATP-binding protein [Leptospirales bacterium]